MQSLTGRCINEGGFRGADQAQQFGLFPHRRPDDVESQDDNAGEADNCETKRGIEVQSPLVADCAENEHHQDRDGYRDVHATFHLPVREHYTSETGLQSLGPARQNGVEARWTDPVTYVPTAYLGNYRAPYRVVAAAHSHRAAPGALIDETRWRQGLCGRLYGQAGHREESSLQLLPQFRLIHAR